MRMFQVITEKEIYQTRDNSSMGILVKWIERLAGIEEAMNVQGWSELSYAGEEYEGENFKVRNIG